MLGGPLRSQIWWTPGNQSSNTGRYHLLVLTAMISCDTLLMLARKLDLPIKVDVYNNSSLGFVAMEMKVRGYLMRAPGAPLNRNLAEYVTTTQ